MAQKLIQYRIFISSPGDVHEEREIARELIDKVLPKDPFIRGRAAFDPISWDDPNAAPGLSAHLTPQEAINRELPKPSKCDVVIVVLWSRMGTPLSKEFTKEDGSPYLSGTEWEFEDALNAAEAKGKPIILLYRRGEEPKIGARDPDFEEKREQLAKVDTFFEGLKGDDGSLKRSATSYTTVEEFRGLLHQNLKSVVSNFLRQGISDELGVTKAAVENMFAILEERQVPPEQLETKLKEIAERHLELTERLHALSKSNDEPEITKRREQAAEAIEQGDYDQANELLAEAVAIDRRALDEQQDALDRRKASAAKTISQQAELERTRLKYRKAAEQFGEAASLLPASDKDARFNYLMKRALVLGDQGKEFGDNPALLEAIEIYRLILNEYTRERTPLDWAVTQNNLGNALQTLGERESDTARLEAAVEAYRAALEEHTRERVPLDWAMTQNNLGIALQALGERESGTDRLKAAVEAYRVALEEYTRERAPLLWATTQNNLGSALRALGERESGTTELEEAVKTFQAALQERTREHAPLDWAMTQNNLGTALQTLGARESGTTRLKAAVEAYRAALEELTRERVPLDWAMTQNNLGNALKDLGERESGTAELKEAVEAFRAALQERTRERVPLDWAMTQNNLGNALRTLGRREGCTATLEAAVEAHRATLDVYSRESAPHLWATAKNNVGSALATLGQHESGTAKLELAVHSFQAAVKELTYKRVPLRWALTQENLGLAYCSIAKKSRNEATLLLGIRAITDALKVFENGGATYNLERARRNLTGAEALLSEIKGES